MTQAEENSEAYALEALALAIRARGESYDKRDRREELRKGDRPWSSFVAAFSSLQRGEPNQIQSDLEVFAKECPRSPLRWYLAAKAPAGEWNRDAKANLWASLESASTPFVMAVLSEAWTNAADNTSAATRPNARDLALLQRFYSTSRDPQLLALIAAGAQLSGDRAYQTWATNEWNRGPMGWCQLPLQLGPLKPGDVPRYRDVPLGEAEALFRSYPQEAEHAILVVRARARERKPDASAILAAISATQRVCRPLRCSADAYISMAEAAVVAGDRGLAEKLAARAVASAKAAWRSFGGRTSALRREMTAHAVAATLHAGFVAARLAVLNGDSRALQRFGLLMGASATGNLNKPDKYAAVYTAFSLYAAGAEAELAGNPEAMASNLSAAHAHLPSLGLQDTFANDLWPPRARNANQAP